jgi:integral membrane sensor domain MASE1
MSFTCIARVVSRTAVACLAAGLGFELAALKAAGLTGTAPSGSAAITQLIATLTSNWEWLIGTGVGLVLVLIAGMMMFGSQRAPDHLFRVIGGIMLILIVIPAVLA